MTLYVPPDLDTASHDWGANCGPGALAALTEKTLAEIRPVLQGINWPGYSNPTHMQKALHALGWCWAKLDGPSVQGLAWVQFCGGWEANARPAYKYTHWIAYRRNLEGGAGLSRFVAFDINNCCRLSEGDGEHHWAPFHEWESEVLPFLLPKHSTGYRVRMWLVAEPAEGARP